LDKIDTSLLLELSKGIPLTVQPFTDIAAKLGISLEEVLTRIASLKQTGIIRRVGVTIKPNNIGFVANAVVVWNVPCDRVNEVGLFLSSFKELTHCYERAPVQGRWMYNMYTVMHAQERQTIEQMTKILAETIGIQDYIIIYSKRDLKHIAPNQEKSQL
jgi:DNA-binding Lrp family transcriptional regulator